MMNWSTMLEDLLPTKWSRRTMELTIVLAGIIITLPVTLPSSMIATWSQTQLLLLIIMTISVLLIGALICLVLVVIAYNKKTKEIKNNIAIQKQFTNILADLDSFKKETKRILSFNESKDKEMIQLIERILELYEKSFKQYTPPTTLAEVLKTHL